MNIPKEVEFVLKKLKDNGYEAYIVGGCVRDILRKKEPQDWDITTNAKPEEIQKTLQDANLKTFYENEFGTVGVAYPCEPPLKEEAEKAPYNIIEVTTYRLEAKYTDKRHPDEIEWAGSLEEDLKRRDFTVNAMAAELNGKKLKTEGKISIIDPFNGQSDLKNKTIRAVGEPKDRFGEDALRMLRAVRFATVLDFKIEEKTAEAIRSNALWLKAISKERIRDEFMKIIMAERPYDGVELLRKMVFLKYIIPELEQGCGVSQNKHHIYEVYEHNLLCLKYAAQKKFNKHVRLAALLHDIGKPKVKQGEGPDATFYNHEVVGAKMAIQILNRLKFSKKDTEKIVKLVRYHLFYYNVDEVSESSVRRLVRQVGPENMDELLQIRMCDRIGSGVPKAEPYKLRHLRYIIEKVSQDPISVKMLNISGNDVIKILALRPGPKVGQILDILMSEVLSDPLKNKREFLEKEIQKLGKLSDSKILQLVQKSRKERQELEIKRDEMTKKKYWVT